MAAKMKMTPRSGNDAMRLGDNATPFSACLAMSTPRSGDGANLDKDATLLGARSEMMTPSLETLGDNTKLCNDSMLGNNA